MENIIIYGSSYPDTIEEFHFSNDYKILGIIDDQLEIGEKAFLQYKVLGGMDILGGVDKTIKIFNNVWSFSNRKKVYEIINSFQLDTLNYHCSSVIIPKTISLGTGNWFHHGVRIGSNVKIGSNCGFRFNAILNHECIIEDHVFLGPGVVLSGRVHIGSNSFIGSGTTILPNIKIGRNCIIGAGSVVTKDIGEGQVVYGNPAVNKKIVKK